MKHTAITTVSLFAATLVIPVVASASTIKVATGDTLYSIASKNHISVTELKKLNNLNSNTVFPGETLLVSQPSTSTVKTSNIEYRTVTGVSWLNVRSGAGNNYKVVLAIKNGTKVEVLGKVNGWYYISVNNIKGYSYSSYFSGQQTVTSPSQTTSTSKVPSTTSPATKQNTVSKYVVKKGDTLFGISKKLGIPVSTIKSYNHLSSNVVYAGQQLNLSNTNNTTSKPSQSTTTTTNSPKPATQVQNSGYYTIKSGDTLSKIATANHTTVDYLLILNPTIKNQSDISVGQIIKVSNLSPNVDPATIAKNVIAAGQKYLGVKYVYGASPTRTDQFDCSSFTQRAFSEGAGIPLPRTTFQQVTVGETVSLNSLQPGDLLFFDPNLDGVLGHVGIYIGNNQMIDAETTYGVHISTLTQGYWLPRLVKAQRVIY